MLRTGYPILLRLQAGDRLAGGFRSEVARCVAADGTEVIVKLAATREHARAEAAALTAWARTGAAARLIDADFDHNALLLEQIRPGTHLPENDPGAIGVAAGLLRALHRAPLPAYPFAALRDSFARMERQARRDAEYEQQTRNEPGRGHRVFRRRRSARSHDLAQSGRRRRVDGARSAESATLGRGVDRPAGMPSLAR